MRRPANALVRSALLLLGAAGLVRGGVVPEGAPIPAPGEPGAPRRSMTSEERARFLRGRALFDRDFFMADGVGPMINCDSCRACHIDPVIGGSGGIDVQVQRPMMSDGTSPVETGELAQLKSVPGLRREEIPETAMLVEERNSPTLLGLGLIEQISEDAILANEDPTDADGDGVRGVAHHLPSGRLGRLGWKAQVPDVRSFVRDAMSNEMGITVPPDATSDFGILVDGDSVQDPELPTADIDDLAFFVGMLDFLPKRPETEQSLQGEQLFAVVGCAKCHVPVLDGVEAYSDLLLHDVHEPGFRGVTQGEATQGLYRTAPLRGLRETAPYFHDGRSSTIDGAVRRHDGEALAVRQAYEALSATDRAALLAFLTGL